VAEAIVLFLLIVVLPVIPPCVLFYLRARDEERRRG
jgi:hypothetical protein